MNCHEIEQWIEGERQPEWQSSALEHAASCPGCAPAIHSSIALEEILQGVSLPAPIGFADRVMARVRHAPRAHTVEVEMPLAETLPWWVAAAAQPATVLAFVLFGFFLWGMQLRPTAAAEATSWLAARLAPLGAHLASTLAVLDGTLIWIGVVVGFSPVIALALLALFQGSQSLMIKMIRSPHPAGRR